MASITSVISLFVLLLATYCYSAPIQPGSNDFTEYFATTQKPSDENEHIPRMTLVTDDEPTERVTSPSTFQSSHDGRSLSNEYLFTTMESSTEFDQRVIRPVALQTRDIRHFLNSLEMTTVDSPSSVESFGQSTGLLHNDKSVDQGKTTFRQSIADPTRSTLNQPMKSEGATLELVTDEPSRPKQKKSMSFETEAPLGFTEATKLVTEQPERVTEEPSRPKQKKSMSFETEAPLGFTEATKFVTEEPSRPKQKKSMSFETEAPLGFTEATKLVTEEPSRPKQKKSVEPTEASEPVNEESESVTEEPSPPEKKSVKSDDDSHEDSTKGTGKESTKSKFEKPDHSSEEFITRFGITAAPATGHSLKQNERPTGIMLTMPNEMTQTKVYPDSTSSSIVVSKPVEQKPVALNQGEKQPVTQATKSNN